MDGFRARRYSTAAMWRFEWALPALAVFSFARMTRRCSALGTPNIWALAPGPAAPGKPLPAPWSLRRFLVPDLDRDPTAAGIDVVKNPDWDMPGVGRFARIHDPEGNPIELWQPD